MASFCYCGRLSSAQLDHWQVLKQWPIIDPHPVEQTAYRRDIKDNGYKSVFTNSWLVRQRNRSWIKGLGKNPQKSELIHWRQCLLSGATEPCPLGLRETLAYIQVILHMSRPRHHVWRVDTAPGKTECVLRRPPIGGWKNNSGLNGIRCELLKERKFLLFPVWKQIWFNFVIYLFLIKRHSNIIGLKPTTLVYSRRFNTMRSERNSLFQLEGCGWRWMGTSQAVNRLSVSSCMASGSSWRNSNLTAM